MPSKHPPGSVRLLPLALCVVPLLSLGGCQTRGSHGGGDPPEVLGAVSIREPDLRTPKRADVVPPPVQGGTLLALADGKHLVVGDADRHRILGVSLDDGSILFDLELDQATLPGRMVEDGEGRVHVVLRGSGELWTLLPESGEVVRRAQVCGEPRGLAYEPATDALHLACAGGTLWTYAATTGEVISELEIAPDLRDVALAEGGALWVSTFRGARVFRVEADGSLAVVPPLPGAVGLSFNPETGEELRRPFVARAAWRLISDDNGSAVVMHQRADQGEIEIEPHAETVEDDHVAEAVVEPLDEFGSSGSSYGGGGDGLDPFSSCGAIVHSALTQVFASGRIQTSGPLPHALLPVDADVTEGGALVAVASAGVPDEGSPKARIEFPEDNQGFLPGPAPACFNPDCSPLGSVQLVRTNNFSEGEPDGTFCSFSDGFIPIPEPAVSVTFVPGTDLLAVQVREPSRLYLVHRATHEMLGRIELGGASVEDTGHDLFHRDSGGGIACASCHLEGQEDGHTWHFSGLGARRTQPLNVRLRGTEPFHWDGAMLGLGSIMSEVFVGRMGGAPQSPERLEALADWMMELEPPNPMRDADDPAAERGKALFESAEVGCASCHNGKKLTNNESKDVGTSDGLPLQVPSLLGVALRTPLMHTGCARTLHERFDPDCGGGDEHGHTSQLSDDEIDDLVAYLETL